MASGGMASGGLAAAVEVARARPRAPLRRLRRDPIGLVEELAAHGDVIAFRIGPQRLILVSDPELVREVLVVQGRAFMKGRALQEAKRVLGNGLLTSEGDRHLRQRRLLQPLFHQERVSSFAEAIVDEALRACGRWRDGEEADVAEEMSRLTLAVVARTLLGADVEDDARDVRESLTEVLESFDRFLLPGAGLLEHLPLPSSRRFRRAQQRLDRVIGRMIDERRSTSLTGPDLLSMLLRARDEDGSGMGEEQVRDEVMTIFVAGHETTAQALCWTWYLLSEHPDVEERLHAELGSVLGVRPPTAADVPSLAFARAVVAESMRLYPPAWTIARRALREVELRGHTVPAGAIVVMSQWVIHRDARWFPEPERFAPERWLADDPGRPRYAYFPFGGGNRVCIGERFAWMEAVLLLATIASRYELRVASGRPLALSPRITLRPAGGLPATLRRRSP